MGAGWVDGWMWDRKRTSVLLGTLTSTRTVGFVVGELIWNGNDRLTPITYIDDEDIEAAAGIWNIAYNLGLINVPPTMVSFYVAAVLVTV
jgi:hypothetical protein